MRLLKPEAFRLARQRHVYMRPHRNAGAKKDAPGELERCEGSKKPIKAQKVRKNGPPADKSRSMSSKGL